ncbi:MAG TPA: hypothetical protein VFG50_16655 [Rhodothermales bacterium]|nr:hypothetical protein [Rhodothermales bacterium]
MEALSVIMGLLQAPTGAAPTGEPAQTGRAPGEAVNGMQDFLAATVVVLLILILIAIVIALFRQRAR